MAKPKLQDRPGANPNQMHVRCDVRLMTIDGQPVIGVRANQDSAELRVALRVLGYQAPVKYLESPNLPGKYKVRDTEEGSPLPSTVVAAMEQASSEPWVVRDRMLAEMGIGQGAMTGPTKPVLRIVRTG
jgi:hypothetical protein